MSVPPKTNVLPRNVAITALVGYLLATGGAGTTYFLANPDFDRAFNFYVTMKSSAQYEALAFVFFVNVVYFLSNPGGGGGYKRPFFQVLQFETSGLYTFKIWSPQNSVGKWQRVFRWLLPEGDAEALIGDLQEAYEQKRGRIGEAPARAWLRRQLIHSLRSLVHHRIRQIGTTVARRLTGR